MATQLCARRRLAAALAKAGPCPRRLSSAASAGGAASAPTAAAPPPPALPTQRHQPLPRLHAPNPADFAALRAASQPAILTGCLSHWRLSAWEPQSLLSDPSVASLVVPLELSRGGGDYRDEHSPRPGKAFARDVEATLGQFVERFLLKAEDEGESGSRGPSTAEAAAAAASASPSAAAVVAYLAQHDLLSRSAALAAASPTPELIPAEARAREGAVQRRAWVGPRGTETPLHRDPYENLLCQAVGRKRVRLYARAQEAHLLPFASPLVLRNTSQVDAGAPDAARRHPGFAAQPFWEGAVSAGEVLYIPRRVWHHVVAETRSASVSFWW